MDEIRCNRCQKQLTSPAEIKISKYRLSRSFFDDGTRFPDVCNYDIDIYYCEECYKKYVDEKTVRLTLKRGC